VKVETFKEIAAKINITLKCGHRTDLNIF